METHLRQLKEIIWVLHVVLHLAPLMVFLVDRMLLCFRYQNWESHLDILISLMKVSYLALLIVICLVLHLDLVMDTHLGQIKELSWVIQMNPSMVTMKELQQVNCLVIYLGLLIELHQDQLMVFLV